MRIEVMPNIITGANLVIGMFALVNAVEGKYVSGAVLILLAALLDGFDGKLARKMGNSTDFGKELDSLADLVSFGVAPAVTAYLWKLETLGLYGLLVVILFVLCGALRLARFNVMNISGYFLGLPITIAGSLVAIMVLTAGKVHEIAAAGIVFVLCWFMVSSIRLPKI
jgi:CDP-diacylglycerol--serine O-phosphatidyltransferase